jgi:Bacterial SH3 domain.
MKQGPKYRIITPIISHIADYHRRSAIQRAGVFLAVIWSFIGPVAAGFDSPPLQERIAILFLCGLVPAAAIYVAGYILSRLIMFRGQVSDITLAGCFGYITFYANYFVNRAVVSSPKVWGEIVRLAQKLCCSVNRLYWRTQRHLIEFAYLLIRSTARFIIRLQASEDFGRGSDELTEARRNQPPFSSIRTSAYGNGGIGLDSGEDGPLGRPDQNDLLESRTSFRLRTKLVAGTAIVAGIGVCACAYFLLPSSNKTAPQSAELPAAVQAVPTSPVQTASASSEFFAAVDQSESLAEPLDASQKVASAALPTRSLRTAPARSGDILFVQRPRVNIRSTPSLNGSVVAIALKGTPFKVTSRQVDWVQVQNGPFRGWINAQFLAPTETR